MDTSYQRCKESGKNIVGLSSQSEESITLLIGDFDNALNQFQFALGIFQVIPSKLPKLL